MRCLCQLNYIYAELDRECEKSIMWEKKESNYFHFSLLFGPLDWNPYFVSPLIVKNS